LKRALCNFGNLLGNCLYDKTYTAEIVKVKVEPVSDHFDLDEPGSNELPIQPKFNKDELHIRPEFQDVKPKVATVPISAQKPVAPKLPNANTNLNIPTRSPTHCRTRLTHPRGSSSASTSSSANNQTNERNCSNDYSGNYSFA